MALVLITAALAGGCKPRYSPGQLKELNHTLGHGSGMLQERVRYIRDRQREGLLDPQQHDLAMFHGAGILAIHRDLSPALLMLDSMVNLLENRSEDDASVVDSLMSRQGKNLYDRLYGTVRLLDSFPDFYRRGGDPSVELSVKEDIVRFKLELTRKLNTAGDSMSSVPSESKKWIADNFGSSTPLMAIVMLNKLRYEILSTEYQWMSYVKNWLPSAKIPRFVSVPVVSANSTVLHSGDSIEVKAGVGLFRVDSVMKYTVGGVTYGFNDLKDGSVEFKPAGKPGYYSIPVIIRYKHWDDPVVAESKRLTYKLIP
ncbi:hypothetical protein [Paraflavitalea sp. CAU 1676]|uniref:hypothetical protein n=1 Tax=Paraflavitalea sp. CAU 1676 TaxID=3032598 RepID=UPI0023DB28CF|nr:hypothetical protein [Paraflavitalea sp. CAU 1676]MDF2189069.1 hypothetical protein [Paraflavitalea sp. CAU 1676]